MKQNKRKPKIIKWPPNVIAKRNGMPRQLVLTDSQMASIYWMAICQYYPNTKMILSEIISALDPKLLPLFLNGAPPFLSVLIANRLKEHGKEVQNG